MHTFTDSFVRLVGGSSYNEGRVEVNYNGEWGTVCDDGWDDTDAGVVCRQLGFGSSGLSVYSASFGEGSGTILLKNLLCTGSEPILSRCGHPGVAITGSCSHNDDAGVICLGGQGLYVTVCIIATPHYQDVLTHLINSYQAIVNLY